MKENEPRMMVWYEKMYACKSKHCAYKKNTNDDVKFEVKKKN